jgi:cytochrome c oxidase subunit II
VRQRRRSGRWLRGSSLALLLASAALLLSGCSASDIEKHLRFGWPTGVTKQAERMRVLWSWSGLAALALGVIVWGLIFWCCIRYHRRDDSIPRQTKYNMVIETICVTVPLLVIIVLFWRTVVVEDYVNNLSKNPDVLVEVDAFKWNWQFEYMTMKDSSGHTVTTAYPGQVDETTGEKNSPLYLNTVGSDDEIPVLVVPKGKTVQVIEHSQDVIHSFWVPEFLFKRDVIPYGTPAQQQASGLRDNRFEFTATTMGSYVGRCAELCGTYHSQMNFEVRVVTPTVYANYLAALKKIGPNDPTRQAKALVEANVPGGAYATTTHPFDTDRTARSASGG